MAKAKRDTGSSKAAPAVKPAAPIFKPLPKKGFPTTLAPQAKAPDDFKPTNPLSVLPRKVVNKPETAEDRSTEALHSAQASSPYLSRFGGHETPKAAPKPTDHIDVFNGGRTDQTPAQQAKIIKDTQSGRLSKLQAHNVTQRLREGNIVPASIALSTLDIPLAKIPGLPRALAEKLTELPKVERSNVLNAIPNVHHLDIFGGDEKGRAKYLKLRHLPPNASDRQVIEDIGDEHDKDARFEKHPWQKLNPFRDGLNPAKVIGNFGESYIHPAFNDFIVAPAHIGAGATTYALVAGKTIADAANPARLSGKGGKVDTSDFQEVNKEALKGVGGAATGLGDMVVHPLKSLQNDPIGTAVTAVTGVDSLAGKLSKGAKVARDVDLPAYATVEGGVPQAVVKRATDQHTRAIQHANREYERTVKRIETKRKAETETVAQMKSKGDPGNIADQGMSERHAHHDEMVGAAAQKRDRTIEAADAHRDLTLNSIDLPNEKPFTINRGYKSKKPITRFFQNALDKRAGGDGIFSTSPLTSLAKLDARDKKTLPSLEKAVPISKGDALLGKNVQYAKDVEVSKAEKALAEKEVEMAKAGHKVPLDRQTELLFTHAEGLSHAEKVALYQRELDATNKILSDGYTIKKGRMAKLADAQKDKYKQIARDQEMQIKFHSDHKTGLPKAHQPFNELHTDEQAWLHAASDVAQYRTKLLQTHGKLSADSSMFRDYQPPIIAAYKDATSAQHELARGIINDRDKLHEIEQTNPDVRDARALLRQKRAQEIVEKRRGNTDQSIGRLKPYERQYLDTTKALQDKLAQFETEYKAQAGIERRVKQGDFEGDDRRVTDVEAPQTKMVPFRVPRQVPKPPSRFSRGNRISRITPSEINDPALRFTDSKQLLEGNFTPSVQPLIEGAQKAAKSVAGYQFLKKIVARGEGNQNGFGVVHARPGQVVGDLVAHPENFVLANVKNLNRQVKRHDLAEQGTASLLTPEASAQAIEDAFKEALKGGENLTADTPIPRGGEHVLLPKGVKDALLRDVTSRPASGWINSLYRTQVLYTRPAFAFRNLAQAVTTNTLEKVGPLSYRRALPRALGGPKKPLPVAPVVEDHGIGAQALHGDYTNSNSLVNLLKAADRTWNPLKGAVTPKGLAKAAKNTAFGANKGIIDIPFRRNLIDSVRGMNRQFENFARRAAYQKIAREHSKDEQLQAEAGIAKIAQGQKLANEDIEKVLDHIANGETKAAEMAARNIVDRITEIQGDYKNMPQWSIAQTVSPFYRWTLFSSTLLLKLPWKYPVANQIAKGLANVGAQAQADLSQDFNDNGPLPTTTNFPIFGSPTKATTVNAEYGNPFTTLVDTIHTPESLLPLVKEFHDAWNAQDTFGNKLKDEYGQPLDTEGKIKNAVTQGYFTLFPPGRNIDQTVNPGQHSADSLPFPLNKVAGGSHDKYLKPGSLEAAQRESARITGKGGDGGPSDDWKKSFVNWLTGIGLHEKDLDATERKAAEFAFDKHMADLKKTGPGSLIYAEKHAGKK